MLAPPALNSVLMTFSFTPERQATGGGAEDEAEGAAEEVVDVLTVLEDEEGAEDGAAVVLGGHACSPRNPQPP